MDQKYQLSIVLPVFNEEGNLRELYQRLSKVLRDELRLPVYEIIFVDDFSQDGSWKIIEELHRNDPSVKGIKFSRNFGHHVALSAGIHAAKGESVVIMDADLQDQPEEISKLYRKMQEGYDIVYGIRTNKQHSPLKNLTSRLFNLLIKSIADTKININTHIFRIMSRRAVDAFNQLKEKDRYIIGLISFAGYSETGVPVEHAERYSGQTKYNLGKMLRLAANTITSFSTKPLQWAGLIGAILVISAILIVGFASHDHFAGMAALVIFIGGVQLLSIGILGEYIGRLFMEVKQRPLYVVEKALNSKGE